MNLSMWILADWLREYETEYRIASGGAVIRSARLLAGEAPQGLAADVVYVSAASSFFDKSGYQVICVQGNDWLKIRNADVASILNEVLNAFDFYNRWEVQLAQAARSGAGPQGLLDLSQGVFRNPCFVQDALGSILAAADSPDLPDLSQGRAALMQQLARTLEPTVLPSDYFGCRSICAEIYLDQEADIIPAGAFFIHERTTPFHPGFVQLAGIFQRELAVCLENMHNQSHLPPITQLLPELIFSQTVDWARWKRTLDLNSWTAEDSFRLFIIQAPEDDPEMPHSLHTLFPASLFCRQENRLLMLLNLKFPTPSGWEAKLEEFLKKSGAFCVYSPVFGDLRLLAGAYWQIDALMYQVPRRAGGLYETLKYAWTSILNQFLRSPDCKALLHPAAATLRAYDEAHATDFTDTLYAFLRHDRSLGKTAQAMSLHRNTLIYRIERIYQLIGSNLDDPEQREHLLFSLEALYRQDQKKPVSG
ncbi:MAG: helix-turn-helix domain-containing protein [Eubacteriales bacterium]|nr:helix-turn-helix domain-containing protein [Eubacteriales bacterium]